MGRIKEEENKKKQADIDELYARQERRKAKLKRLQEGRGEPTFFAGMKGSCSEPGCKLTHRRLAAEERRMASARAEPRTPTSKPNAFPTERAHGPEEVAEGGEEGLMACIMSRCMIDVNPYKH